ncbi:MAG: hypothetical protein JW863_14930 [Chitinispirillaceae bacterium]|nr:hypothetical protein [Chitinispirillaceae bacterium]
MHEKSRVFLRMFEMELEDLHKDIEMLIDRYTDEHDHEAISNYVFLENIALMNNELFGIDSFIEEVRGTDPSRFSGVAELIDFLTAQLYRRCREKGYATSACVLAERKMRKINSYLESDRLEWEHHTIGQSSVPGILHESSPLI